MHQRFVKNKRLLLIFNDGHQEFGKYRISERGVLYFFDRDPVPLHRLRSVGYYKGPAHTLKEDKTYEDR